MEVPIVSGLLSAKEAAEIARSALRDKQQQGCKLADAEIGNLIGQIRRASEVGKREVLLRYPQYVDGTPEKEAAEICHKTIAKL
jgi:hypothetical protein